MNLNLQKYFSLLALAGFLLLGILDVFLFMPLVTGIQKAKDQHKNAVQEVFSTRNILQNPHNTIVVQLTSPNKVQGVKDKLLSIAEKQEIDLVFKEASSQDKPDEILGSYVKKSFDIQASGSFKNIGLLLAGLMGLPDAVLDVEKMDVSSNGDYSTNVVANITLVLLVSRL
ncbi:MAG: hypothetical protein WCH62_09005 [Candidatus Omnitrophota bacterium]